MATQPEDLGQDAGEQVVTDAGAGTEGVQDPGAATPDDDNEPPAPDPVADLAKTMGWRPKEEFKGDPNLWKPAEDYIRAGSEIQRGQSRELKDLRATMENVARTNAAIVQSTIAAEREKLVAQYNQAVDDGNAQAAFKIGGRITELNNKEQGLTTSAPTPPAQETNDWVARNGWFNSDVLGRNLALSVADQYAKAGKSAGEQLQAAEAEVRRVYPHLFGTPSKGPNELQPPPSRSSSPRKIGTTFADLPQEAKKIAKDMADRGVIPSVEAYAKQYWQSAEKKA